MRATTVFLLLSTLGLACENPAEPVPADLLPKTTVHLDQGLQINGAVLGYSSSEGYLALVELRNPTTTAGDVVYGVCAFSILAYRTPEPQGRPTWSSLEPWGGECGPDIAFVHSVPAGQTLLVQITALPPQAIHDPVSGTRNSLFVVLQVAGESRARQLSLVPIVQ